MIWILAAAVVVTGFALAWRNAGRQQDVRVPIRGEEAKRQVEAARRLEERQKGASGPIFPA